MQERVQPSEKRCHCGSLIGVVEKGWIEVKCRRCKRVVPVYFREMVSRRLFRELLQRKICREIDR